MKFWLNMFRLVNNTGFGDFTLSKSFSFEYLIEYFCYFFLNLKNKLIPKIIPEQKFSNLLTISEFDYEVELHLFDHLEPTFVTILARSLDCPALVL